MKTHDIEAPRALFDLSGSVKPGFIRVMSEGKAVAYVLLATDYDEEDIGYMTDPSFWKMISERRKSNGGIPLEEIKAKLVAREQRENKPGALKRRPRTAKTKRR